MPETDKQKQGAQPATAVTAAASATATSNVQEKKDAPKEPVNPYMQIHVGEITGATKIPGVRIDFNFGARAQVPEGQWRVRLIDRETASVIVDQKLEKTMLRSKKSYYIPWRVEIWKDDKMVLAHDMNLKGRNVLLKNCSGAMGDTIAWAPYAREFRKEHQCEVYYAISPALKDVLQPAYPEIHFIAPDERPDGMYASYYIGCFFPSNNREFQPSSWKIAGLQGAASNILGLRHREIRPELKAADGTRKIKEPYVCIAVQASSQAKYWNNPLGWIETVKHLKSIGYRVLCIDRSLCYGKGHHYNYIPWGAEDFTGDHPLMQRLELLQYADFFIGLPSGLSWLAWGAGIPVVLISGFSIPSTEFYTPYRVINYNVCNGCWEDTRYEFEHKDFYWCPRHKDDEAHCYECTRSINSGQVIQTIKRLMADHHLDPKNAAKPKKT